MGSRSAGRAGGSAVGAGGSNSGMSDADRINDPHEPEWAKKAAVGRLFAAQQSRYATSSAGTSTPGLFSVLKPSRGGATPESTPTRIKRR